MKTFIVRWNNKWLWDYAYRKKYNIAFNSPQHRELNQIDMRIDFLEEEMISDHIKSRKEKDEKMDHYEKTGEWLRYNENEEVNEELFENIDLSKL